MLSFLICLTVKIRRPEIFPQAADIINTIIHAFLDSNFQNYC